MKLFATVVASAASQGFYDYNLFNSAPQPASNYGKFGTVSGGATGGARAGNGLYCHATKDSITIHRWDVSKNGFFAHYNLVECQGEEQYCFMEERSHFGQVIGIRAGCAQMMNHPQIRRTRITQQSKFNNNREAFRQRSFKNSGDSTALVLGYGVGGCMAMHVQNHDQLSEPVLDDTFDAKVNANNFFYPSWYQSQCLRSVARANGQGAWHDLLPFGVSVCRACCVAGEASETDYSDDTGATAPCNFLPYKQPQLDANTKNERPHIPFGYDFDCIDGYAQDMSAVAALTHEYKGILSLAQVAGSSSAFSASLGVNSCTSNCANSKKTESLPTDVMAAAGGITYHEPTATKGKIREFSCNDVIHNQRGEGDYIDPNDHSQGKYARTDAQWYNSGPDGICDGNMSDQVECYPSTFTRDDLLIGSTITVSNAFNFNAHTWAGEGASACDICRNELVPRFDAVSFNSGSIVNLFSLACDGTNKRCDPKPKTVIDMALNPNGK